MCVLRIEKEVSWGMYIKVGRKVWDEVREIGRGLVIANILDLLINMDLYVYYIKVFINEVYKIKVI